MIDAKEKRVLVSIVAVGVAVVLSVITSLGTNVLVVRLDAVGSIVELFALFITYAALRRAKAAPDDRFNYGLSKLENLCGLLFGQVHLVYMVIFIWMALNRLQHPVAAQGAGWSALLYVYGTVVTGTMMMWSLKLHRDQPSPVTSALYRGYQIKVFANITTGLVMLVVVLFPDHAFTRLLDPLNVLALCALRLRNIFHILRESGRDLLDAAVSETLKIKILRVLAAHFDAYDDLLTYETRRSPNMVRITVHLGFSSERSLEEVFQAQESISREIAALVTDAKVDVVPHRCALASADGDEALIEGEAG